MSVGRSPVFSNLRRKVIFYEIDPDAFSLLKRNCQTILDGNEEDESMENQSQEGSSENSSDQEEKMLEINAKFVQEEIDEGKKPQSLKPSKR